MALTFLGVDEFKIAGPPQWRPSLWDLDTLIVPYSGPITALDAFIDSLEKGSEYDGDENMFLVDYPIQNAHKQYPSVDLIYSGKRGGVLPSQKRDTDSAVQSVSSIRSSAGTILTSPMTLQFYAPTSSISYISFGAKGTQHAPAPTDDLVPISLTTNDTAFAVGGVLKEVVDQFFTTQFIETANSTELVPGKYWQNKSTVTKLYSQWLLEIVAGAYVTLAYVGTGGFSVGNTFTIAAGGEFASITITAIGVSGTPTDWTVGTNTFTAAHNFLSGPHSTLWNVFIIS